MTLLQHEPSAQAPCTKRIFAFFIGPPCGLFVQGLCCGFALDSSRGIVGGVIGVTASIERIERAAVIRRERKSVADATWKIRIGDEVAAEGDCVRGSALHSRL